MFKFPDWPHTLTVRRLECISCKYLLEVSAEQVHYKGDRTEDTPFANWSPRHNSSVHRFFSTSHATEQAGSSIAPHLFCPRCGADNHNWLYLSHRPAIFFSANFRNIIVVIAGMLISIFMFIGYQYYMIGELTRLFFYFMLLLLAGIVPLLVIVPQLRALRDYKYLKKVSGFSFSNIISPPLKTAILLGIITLIFLPSFYYLILPRIDEWSLSLIQTESNLTQVERIDKLTSDLPVFYDKYSQHQFTVANIVESLQQNLFTEQAVCTNIEIKNMAANLRMILSGDAKLGNAALLANAISELEAAQELNTPACYADLLEGTTLLLTAYLASDNRAVSEITSVDCSNQITAFEATHNKQMVTLAPACHEEMIVQIMSRLNEQIEAFSRPNPSASPEDMKAWMAKILGGIRTIALLNPNSALPKQIEENLASLEKLLYPKQKDPDIGKDVKAIVTWSKTAGKIFVLSLLLTLVAVYYVESTTDSQLPRPVFSSMSWMTQTAKWEINRTSEPRGLAEHIQWVQVERNREGGINLIGLFRDPPDLENGGPTDRVRAQRYVIVTDPWCYIRSTTITDEIVDRPAGGPAFVVPEDAHPDTAERSTPVRVRW